MSLEAKYLISTDELGALTAQPATSVLAALGDGQMLRLPGGRTGIRPEAARTALDARGFDYAFRVIAHVNLKGGTGKTTTITAASRAVLPIPVVELVAVSAIQCAMVIARAL